MDTLSHGLYGGGFFGRKNKRNFIIAFLFGILPDIFAFGPHFVLAFVGITTWHWVVKPPHYPAVPEYIHTLYNISHSFFVYGIFFALLWVAGKRAFALLTFGWPLHILVDIPTHSADFFPTHFLWPLSDFHISGIPWGEPIIFIPNVIALLVLYIQWYWKDRSRTR